MKSKAYIVAILLFAMLIPCGALSAKNKKEVKKDERIWAVLLHIGFNMWEEYLNDTPLIKLRGYYPYLRMDEKVWDDAVKEMAKQGMTMVIVDLADGIKYESHPEIAVSGAWTREKLRRKIKEIHDLGMEAIPKLNFSTGHDLWLKEYAFKVSTDEYYKVCSDLIKEVSELFDNPRFFHIGMDEEGAEYQPNYLYANSRNDKLWWHDLTFLVGEVEKCGSKAWIWSDRMLWKHPDQFFAYMPKDIIQSNWCYERIESPDQLYVKDYITLDKNGYKQVPTASYHADNYFSIDNTVKFGKEYLSEETLKGFMQTPWCPSIEEYREKIIKSIVLAGEAKRRYYPENDK